MEFPISPLTLHIWTHLYKDSLGQFPLCWWGNHFWQVGRVQQLFSHYPNCDFFTPSYPLYHCRYSKAGQPQEMCTQKSQHSVIWSQHSRFSGNRLGWAVWRLASVETAHCFNIPNVMLEAWGHGERWLRRLRSSVSTYSQPHGTISCYYYNCWWTITYLWPYLVSGGTQTASWEQKMLCHSILKSMI